MQISGIPQDFESARFGILNKLPLSFLEILKFMGTQFSVVHGGVDIFWNSQIVLPGGSYSTLLALVHKANEKKDTWERGFQQTQCCIRIDLANLAFDDFFVEF